MPTLDLSDSGITHWETLYYNLSYDELFHHETDPALDSSERGIVTECGAVNVLTGKFTGRSPKDKYIVRDDATSDNVWWASDAKSSSDNHAISQETWNYLKEISCRQLNGKKLYVVDAFCGANPNTRLNVRLITEVAWVAHFAKNMFIRPTPAEIENFSPDWTILHACKTTATEYAKYGLRSPVYIAFNITERQTLIGGTWYGGEIKKGIFSVMNYMLPRQGIGSFHCSANQGKNGDTALFFGLSGTGKTTLSTDPNRQLIGDDEHGWDDDGIFNFEGGCYAKCIGLTKAKEPDIYRAIKRNALLENVDVNEAGIIDFTSNRITENTRVSYPITHIDNIVTPVSSGGHPRTIIFLTCDAYGVLPPIARLNRDQAMYHYLSGYTAKVAGTEIGVTEPTATFSACFGHPFLLLHPTCYAKILGKKMDQHRSAVYLVNTGWTSGSYGVGHRMNLKMTRSIIQAVLDRSIDTTEWTPMPIFNIEIPRSIAGINPELLNPILTWQDSTQYTATLKKLAQRFIENFSQFTDTDEGKRLVQSGPIIAG